MKKWHSIVALSFSCIISAQNVVFSKVIKSIPNDDKNLFAINEIPQNTELLAEVEVLGFSNDDQLIYSQLYKKAKEVGANQIKFQPFIGIDEKPQKLDPHHYKLALYYNEKSTVNQQQSYAYIFGASTKDVKITLNDKKIVLPARTYIAYPLHNGQLLDLRVGNFLGSRIKVTGSLNTNHYYFQLSGNKIGAGDAGLNLKGGDIVGVEQSFGEFLKIIYKQQAIVK